MFRVRIYSPPRAEGSPFQLLIFLPEFSPFLSALFDVNIARVKRIRAPIKICAPNPARRDSEPHMLAISVMPEVSSVTRRLGRSISLLDRGLRAASPARPTESNARSTGRFEGEAESRWCRQKNWTCSKTRRPRILKTRDSSLCTQYGD